ncbi:DUF3427 domain-containing protein [Enterococcus mediterraneensis]|uniref:DUF3427 domain-containing protein n=1 Tax=Enterococcus mediterraneensis TaxID=2364791 RepID=UPI000F0687C2|nr:DEAD/DEAH box helicase [Enterococcus mediterraneensis]
MIDTHILEQALHKAFIDQKIDSGTLNPRFIVNRPEKKEFFLNTLQEEFASCLDFILSVAFITQSGLNAIKVQLADLAERGITGRILTSTYLSFNHPDVFESLLNIPNLEVRISKKEGFHAKGYLFKQKEYESFIIGSSNLTMQALKLNYEWNVKLTSFDQGEMLASIRQHLEKEWAEAQPLTRAWLTKFKEQYQETEVTKLLTVTTTEVDAGYIVPNKMQKAALESLKYLRQEEQTKGLVISATGTGKTYLAAFDVAQVKPKRMLFIVHREQILKKAMETFKKVLGGSESDYGILSGNSKDLKAKYLFATIQTISKDSYQNALGAKAFDYILIDEVHKAGAQSYIKTIDFFKPEFLLGMTATPERTDGFNIYELFDYNIAYEIRLQEALDEDLLCPFHYFGVTDYERDGQVIEETTDLQFLLEEERVDFLIEKIRYYGCSHNTPRGLVFCSRKEEAQHLAELFNQRGIPSSYLSGDHSTIIREQEIQKLESNIIQYIFTVDIFNEGIDIPKINQVIMLRNTESSIIFIQQLGRGLRKDKSKDFVTVIDFIGNYRNNYMIPMALSGDNSRNKNNLRRDTFDTNYISGLSAINFEKVAKERIFKSIDAATLNSLKEIRESFFALKQRLNHTPYLMDFQMMGGIDPLLLANKEKTYYNLLLKFKENEGVITEQQNLALLFVTRELLNGVRPHELFLLRYFLMDENRTTLTVEKAIAVLKRCGISATKQQVLSSFHVLDLSFFEASLRRKYQEIQLAKFIDDQLVITPFFEEARKNEYWEFLLLDLTGTGVEKSREYDLSQPLTLYKKYRRKDVLRVLDMTFNQNEQGIGGYTFSNHHMAIFVTLDKGKNFQASQIAYEDEFIDEQTFKWFTKSNRTMDSKEVQLLLHPEDWQIHLFIKRKYNQQDNETDFYYLGEIYPIAETIRQTQKPMNEQKMANIVELEFRLKDAVEPNIYKFLTSSLEE